MKIEGCVAVVSGGAQGIGKAISKALLQNKAKVTEEHFSEATSNRLLSLQIGKSIHTKYIVLIASKKGFIKCLGLVSSFVVRKSIKQESKALFPSTI